MQLLTRDEWGARPPRAVSRIATPTAVLALHHFAIDRRGPSGARWCQNLHMDDRGMYDVAYTLMADHEAVYEGRGPGVGGGHTRGWNDRAHAVAAMIDGRTAVDDPVLDRLAEAAVHLWREGAVAAPAYTGGHRDYSASSCPGDELYARIPEINRRAAALADPGGPPVTRLAGANRFETAALFARTRFGDRRWDSVVLVRDGSADGQTAPQLDAPVLLVSDVLPEATAEALRRHRPREVIIGGGEAVISPAVEQAARRAAA